MSDILLYDIFLQYIIKEWIGERELTNDSKGLLILKLVFSETLLIYGNMMLFSVKVVLVILFLFDMRICLCMSMDKDILIYSSVLFFYIFRISE